MGVTALLALGVGGACGESRAIPDQPSTCAGLARQISVQSGEYAPEDMEWRDGKLYYDAFPGIRVVSDQGGASSLLVTGGASRLWLRGERILYALGSQLFSAPIAGGDATLVGGPEDPPGGPLARTGEIDDTAYYWQVVEGSTASTIWRLPLGGGEPQALGQVQVEGLGAVIPLGDDVWVLGALGRDGAVLPKRGGAARPLDTSNGSFLATDGTRVLWWRRTAAGDAGEGSELRVSDPAGVGAHAIWWERPHDSEPYKAWPDGRGGWYVRLIEKLAGERYSEDTFWHIDASGVGARVGCRLEQDEDEHTDPGAVAIGRDGQLFLTVERITRDAVSWRLMSVGP